jgi:hypothetical protein
MWLPHPLNDLQMCSTTSTPAKADRDFDFLIGTWHTRQRRLKRRLQGCDEWEVFDATSRVQQLPGGVANFDTLVAEAWRPGWVGMSLRVFDPRTDLWSIYWITNDGGGIDAASGQLSPPVVGRFAGDEGLFAGEDLFEGRPIRVRYRWLRQGPDRARWEQAFSADRGQSWEVNWVMDFERAREDGHDEGQSVPAADIDCQVVELRQYTLHAGQRDTLIELFDREFVETQEAAGMAVMGQFRDLDRPDRFVWLRGFPDMDRRAASLGAFYGGPVWQRHRNAANATMIDSDDVLLLRPAWPGAGMNMHGRSRAAGAVRSARPGLIDLGIFHLREPAPPDLLRFCREVMTPCLQRANAKVLGWYVTESAPNNFPRLPVREDVHVLVGVAAFEDAASLEAFTQLGAWAREVHPELSKWLLRPAESRRLIPTARSAIHL